MDGDWIRTVDLRLADGNVTARSFAQGASRGMGGMGGGGGGSSEAVPLNRGREARQRVDGLCAAEMALHLFRCQPLLFSLLLHLQKRRRTGEVSCRGQPEQH